MKTKSWVIVLGLTLSVFSGAYAGMGDHKGHGKMDMSKDSSDKMMSKHMKEMESHLASMHKTMNKMDKTTNLDNSSVNTTVGDEPNCNPNIKICKYMKNITTGTYELYCTKDSLNEQGQTYVWALPSTDTKCGTKNKLTL